jgi:hypothetical protein
MLLKQVIVWYDIATGWWFGTWFFPYIGNNNPKRLICFRGVETTNQVIYMYIL